MALSHPETNELTQQIIGLSIQIHKDLGPGLLESAYDDSLYWDLIDSGFAVDRQRKIPILRKSRIIPAAFRADLIVNEKVIVEVKCLEKVIQVHRSQLLTYMRLSRISVGLLINFNVDRLVDGITRLSL